MLILSYSTDPTILQQLRQNLKMIFVLWTNIEEICLRLSICASWSLKTLLITDLRLFIALDFCNVSSPVQCGLLHLVWFFCLPPLQPSQKEAQDAFTGMKEKLSSSNGSEIHCFFFQYYIKEVYTFYQEKSMCLFPQSISILKTIIRICPLLHNIVFTYKAQTSFLPSFYVNESFACIYICVSCACSFCRCQEKIPDPLELEL